VTYQRQRMCARREAERRVLGQQVLVAAEPSECQLLMSDGSGRARAGAGRGPHPIERPWAAAKDRPAITVRAASSSRIRRKPPTHMSASIACAFELRRSAPNEIATLLNGPFFSRSSTVAVAVSLTPVTDESQSDAHGPPAPGRWPPFPGPWARGTLPWPVSTVHQTSLTLISGKRISMTVAHGIAAERIDRVEAHRLIVEERDVILDGVIVPEPGRLIPSSPNAAACDLGNPNIAEGDHLAEHLLGHVASGTPRARAPARNSSQEPTAIRSCDRRRLIARRNASRLFPR